MPNTICPSCKKVNYRSPSKVQPRNYCNSKCYSKERSEELNATGRAHRFQKGRPEVPGRIEAMKKLAGTNNYAWKGESVGYRGLHQWVRRLKGKPTTCSTCGKFSEKPRIIQWANIDGQYRRDVHDFVAMCCSCHKKHDLALAKSKTDSPFAIR